MPDIAVLLPSGLWDFYCLTEFILSHGISILFFPEKFHKSSPYGNILTVCNYMIRFP